MKNINTEYRSCKNCGHRSGSVSWGTCMLSGVDCTVERRIPTKCGQDFQGWTPRPKRKGLRNWLHNCLNPYKMDTITVTIPKQLYCSAVYRDNKNCYLAQALKKAGYMDVRVAGYGYTTIGSAGYRPTNTLFGHAFLQKNLPRRDIEVTLIRS